jgi:pimeloyl-ACP methyl ester carboxylesterase
VRGGILALCVAAAAAAAGGGPAQAARFHHCSRFDPTQCATVRVPLDRSGHVKGRVALHVERVRAPRRKKRPAPLLLLAGGPGQAAVSTFAFDIEGTFDPYTTGRDTLVFDQRGTGRSGLLRCPRLQREQSARAAPGCARSIGPRRRFYRSIDSVEDIEAVRRVVHAPKLAIYGVSYGTLVAQEYALLHPDRVAVLVLDSLVPIDGSDAFERDTTAAVPRAFDAICRPRCPGVPARPSHVLRSLVRRLPLSGPLVSPSGHRRRVKLSAGRLFDLLVGSDNYLPAHVELPAAIRSASRGDLAPILRLWHRNEEFAFPASELSVATFAATRCEEGSWPWDRTAPPGERLRQARAALAQLPASTFAPFPRVLPLFTDSDIDLCARWPQTPQRPPLPGGPFPRVRTLVLAGTEDLRTPLETARRVTRQFLHGKFRAFARTGHAAVEGDPSGCAAKAVRRFLAGHRIKRCREGIGVRPHPPLPRSLRGLRPTGARGRRGRTVHAALATLDDAWRQTALDEGRVGGLRAGWMRAGLTTIALHGVVYVPGVRVSGHVGFDAYAARLRIAGSRAARGRLRVHGLHVVGRLGGRRIDARVRRSGLPPSFPFGPIARRPRVRRY